MDFNKRSPEYLYNNCRICHDHFEKICFLNDLKNRLHEHAVPSIFSIPDQPSSILKKRKLPSKHNLSIPQSKKKIYASELFFCKGSKFEGRNPPIEGLNTQTDGLGGIEDGIDEGEQREDVAAPAEQLAIALFSAPVSIKLEEENGDDIDSPILKRTLEISTTVTQNLEKEPAQLNEIDSFYNYVAAKVHKYSPEVQQAVQHAVFEILVKADKGLLDCSAPNDPYFCNSTKPFTVGIGGPEGAGKTALILALSQIMRDEHSLCIIINAAASKEDREFLVKNKALPPERIIVVEMETFTHTAAQEDHLTYLKAVKDLTQKFQPEIIFLESAGDNSISIFNQHFVDYIVYVIDMAGDDRILCKGGVGITQSDLLVINKTDLAHSVGASLQVLTTDAERARQDKPTIFVQAKNMKGISVVANHIVNAFKSTCDYPCETILPDINFCSKIIINNNDIKTEI